MIHAELITEVYNLTNRPDIIAETAAAVRAATLKAHHSDFFSKDMYEVPITFEEAAYIHTLDYISVLPNYRALNYLRKFDEASDEPMEFITIITPTEVLDSYNVRRLDIAYVAGRAIEIRSSTEFSKLLMGAYVSPVISSTDYSSWVADLYPYAIVFEAARVVFKTIGYDEQSAQFERLVAEQYAELKINALPDVAF